MSGDAASCTVMDAHPEEYELACRARAGDREALEELVARTRRPLFALAYAELRHYDDAQDAVAEALLQVCRHVRNLRAPERILPWMRAVLRNEIHRIRQGPAPSVLDETDQFDTPSDAALLRADVEMALRRIPTPLADASRMFYLHDLSVKEIAEATGRPEGTVKSRLLRGRRQLAREMKEYGPMSPTPNAAVLQTEMDSATVQRLTRVLKQAGYQPAFTPRDEIARLLDILESGELTPLDRWLEPYALLVLDEQILGHSAFKLLFNLQPFLAARSQTSPGPQICLLCEDTSRLTAMAAWHAGVDRFGSRAEPGDLVPGPPRPDSGPDPLWGRLTERARRVIYFAQEEASRRAERFVGTEHLLLALLRETDHAAAGILVCLGISPDDLRNQFAGTLARSVEPARGEMRLTPGAQSAVELAGAEAQELGNNYLGSEHLLLGLIREERGKGAQALIQRGATLEKCRKAVTAIHAGA